MTVPEQNPYEAPKYDATPSTAIGSESEFVLTGRLTVDDVVRAQRLATRYFWLRCILLILPGGVFTIGLIAMAVSARPYSPQASNQILLVACVILPTVVAIPIVFRRVHLHRIARKKIGVFADFFKKFTPERIVVVSANAKVELKWATFSRCAANDKLAVLFFAHSKTRLILSRDQMKKPESWDAFVSMMQSQFGKPSGGQATIAQPQRPDDQATAGPR